MSTTTRRLRAHRRAARPGLVPRSLAALAGIVAAASALAVGRARRRVHRRRAVPRRRGRRRPHRLRAAGLQGVRRRRCSARTTSRPSLVLVAAVLAVGAGLGLARRRRARPPRWPGSSRWWASAPCAGLRETAASRWRSCPRAVQAIVGIQASSLLARAPQAAADDARRARRGRRRAGLEPTPRRGFLLRAGGLGALAVVGGGLGRALVEGRAAQVADGSAEIPPAGRTPRRRPAPTARSTSRA